MENPEIHELLIKAALEEDLGIAGDVTSESVFSDETGEYLLVSREKGILCGKDIFERVFNYIDPEINIVFFCRDSGRIYPGDTVARIEGKIVSILKGERTALNFISMLSAIATKTAKFTEKAAGRVRILDTRKTIPCYRNLSKYAVRCGGGENHRKGLFDMALVKDTHIDAAGSIKEAVDKIRDKHGGSLKIEVEARNIGEVEAALMSGADRIMLDNMNNRDMAEAVKLIGRRAETEASGNMSFERIEDVIAAGVDCISFGELTHTIKGHDFSLKEAGKIGLIGVNRNE